MDAAAFVDELARKKGEWGRVCLHVGAVLVGREMNLRHGGKMSGRLVLPLPRCVLGEQSTEVVVRGVKLPRGCLVNMNWMSGWDSPPK